MFDGAYWIFPSSGLYYDCGVKSYDFRSSWTDYIHDLNYYAYYFRVYCYLYYCCCDVGRCDDDGD